MPARLANTLALPSQADQLIEVGSEQALQSACRSLSEADQVVRVLGGGSNLLLPERVAGTVLRWQGGSIEVTERQVGTRVAVRATAGLSWHELVRRCVALGLGGIENLALIPGTVGAAPIQNIGAYGSQLSDVLESVRVYDTAADSFIDLAAIDCGFGYRDSVFKRRPSWIVCSVTLALTPVSRRYEYNLGYGELATELAARYPVGPSLRNVMETVIAVRRRKLPSPRSMPNVGSFFKNPVLPGDEAAEFQRRWPDAPMFPAAAQQATGKAHTTGPRKVAAAWLIEQCGFKRQAERQPTRVGVWHRQPLVLVNPGAESLRTVLDFAAEIVTAVEARFDIDLEREPELWPEELVR